MAIEDGGVPTGDAPKRPSRLFGIKIIKLGFQLKFSFILLGAFSFCAYIIWMQGYWAVNQLINSGLIVEPEVLENLHLLNSIQSRTAWLCVVFLFVFLLLYSHFLAGPVYRFEKTLEEIQKGNLAPMIRLRRWDEFKEMAEKFTQALAGLRLRLKKERDSVDAGLAQLGPVVEELNQSGHAAAAQKIEAAAAKIKSGGEQIQL